MHPRLALIADGLAPDGPPSPQVEPVEPVENWWADHTRVAEEAAPSPPAGDLPPALPVPGRHAARRRVRLVPRGLPVLAPVHVAVVAVMVAVALAVTTWWVARDQPVSSGPPAAAGESVEPLLAAATPTATPTGSPGVADGTVTVDVAGKVRRPGIVVLDKGARVTDALSAAGGAKRGVDVTPLNLARVLVDGEQIVVGAPAGAAPAPAPGGGAAAPGAAGPLVNLNLASQTELEGLPQVGPVTAQSIIAWREQRGGFTSVDELLEVDGIGQKTLERLAPHVTV
ncbi:helix-hairpin-helix domain-containing protein [Nocardioides sp. WS12]|uniref:helix-hairpin-helix domain-containing protein n=1 Tax=Nocardioides sp. WS12 TaxID=2486272 RepID=UPI00191D8572|nr:helix-hairpin-helix domain-containing protein [Nocardioides sp. WS12]